MVCGSPGVGGIWYNRFLIQSPIGGSRTSKTKISGMDNPFFLPKNGGTS
jgi:hypothetical protein